MEVRLLPLFAPNMTQIPLNPNRVWICANNEIKTKLFLFIDFNEPTCLHLGLSTLIQLMILYFDMLLEEPSGTEFNLVPALIEIQLDVS